MGTIKIERNELHGQPFIGTMAQGVDNLCRDCRNCISGVLDEKFVYQGCGNNNAKFSFGLGSDKQLLDTLEDKPVGNYCKYFGISDKARRASSWM